METLAESFNYIFFKHYNYTVSQFPNIFFYGLQRSRTHLCLSLCHSTQQLSESNHSLLQRLLLLLPGHGRV